MSYRPLVIFIGVIFKNTFFSLIGFNYYIRIPTQCWGSILKLHWKIVLVFLSMISFRYLIWFVFTFALASVIEVINYIALGGAIGYLVLEYIIAMNWIPMLSVSLEAKIDFQTISSLFCYIGLV